MPYNLARPPARTMPIIFCQGKKTLYKNSVLDIMRI